MKATHIEPIDKEMLRELFKSIVFIPKSYNTAIYLFSLKKFMRKDT